MRTAPRESRSLSLVSAASGVLLGAFFLLQLPAPPSVAASILLVTVALLSRVKLSWNWLLWFSLGFLWTGYRVDCQRGEGLAPELIGRDTAVVGWVDDFAREGSRQLSFSLRVPDAIRPEGVPRRLRLTWYDPPIGVEAGVALSVVVRLKSPRGLVNPGGFDYEHWLFTQGYGATGYVREGALAHLQPIGLTRWWLIQRARLARRILSNTPGDDAPLLLTALVLGERFGFEDRHWEVLRRTGTSHLMAISGLHIGLVAAFFFLLIRRCWLYLPSTVAHYDLLAASLFSLCCAAAYAAAAGFAVPTQRALLMLAVASAAILSRRFVSMTVGLSTAAVCVVLLDPFAVSSASFWLSFLAVGLLWQLGQSRPGSVGKLRSIRHKVRDSARVQWGVCLGLAPVVAVFFGELSLVAPLVNFIAIPLFSLVVVPLTLLGAVSLYSDSLGPLVIQIPGQLTESVWSLLIMVSNWRWAAVDLPYINLWSLALAAAGVVLALPIHPLPGRYLSGLAILPLVFGRTSGPAPGAVKATVLDVGHGLAVIVQTERYLLLYDTGPLYRSGFDSGREIVLPALRALGRDEVDTIVISHSDSDHSGGADVVMKRFPRAQVIAGPDVELPGVSACRTGETWSRDGVRFEFLHPPVGFAALGNDSSCVLRVSTNSASLLIPGDVEVRGEKSLADSALDLRSDVVIVPHHGSSTSSSQSFVDAVNAEYAVVSSAFANQWGFPRPDVRSRWEQTGARVLATGAGGAITITLGSSRGIEVETRRERRRRYWQR